MLTTDYGDETAFENRQREQTFRGVLSWDHIKEKWKVGVKGGYIHTWMAYDYRREVAPDNWASMTRSRSKINTFYGQAEAEYSPGRKWFFTSNVSVYQHLVRSEDKNIILQDGNKAVVGYDKGACRALRFCIGQMAACRAVGLVAGLARGDVGRQMGSAHPGILHRRTDFAQRERDGESLRIAQLSFSDFERPLLSAGRQPRP